MHYSIQADHGHFLVEAAGREALGRGMKSLGSRLARAVNRVFQRTGPVLRDRYHLHVLRSPKEALGKPEPVVVGLVSIIGLSTNLRDTAGVSPQHL